MHRRVARGHSTAIYYLLEAGDCSAWHRVTDAAEVWHYYAGAPLALTLSPNGHDAASYRLGPDIAAGERPQVVVPAGHWQTAESLGALHPRRLHRRARLRLRGLRDGPAGLAADPPRAEGSIRVRRPHVPDPASRV